jgi:hypothetical protein
MPHGGVASLPRRMRILSQWLNRFLFGAGVARANDHVTQLEVIIAAYAANLFLVLCLVCVLLAAGGLYQPFREPFSSVLPLALTISNAATFALTFLSSLRWRANRDFIRRVRETIHSQGPLHEFMNRYVIPFALMLWGLLSLMLIIVLFRTLELGVLHPLAIGNLAGSVGANALLLQMIFMRRSLRT